MRRVALATSQPGRDGDPDLTELADTLVWQGIDAAPVDWDDRDASWGDFDLVVIRSTWDYPERHREFVRWLRRVERRTRLANAANVVEWNLDKRYLRDLADAGVPTVPTTWFEPGDVLRLPARGEVVVKPVVSAGARGALRVALPEDHDQMVAHAEALLAAGPIMVQPYLAEVDGGGEVDLVFLDGKFSHAVRKAPALGSPDQGPPAVFGGERVVAVEPEASRLAVAERALAVAAQRGPLLYARVDTVPDPHGEAMVLEVEVAEPALFLATAEGGVERFAAAITRWLEG